MITFGELIKKERERAGYTLKELVELAEDVCTPGYISNIERNADVGKKGQPGRPGIDIVDGLAKALGIPLKTARAAAGYAGPDEESFSEAGMGAVFGKMFIAYERLTPEFRAMAVKLCAGVLENLYEVQIGKATALTAISPETVRTERAAALKKVPHILAVTETELERGGSSVERQTSDIDTKK